MSEEKPTAAFVLALIGGILIFIVGLFVFFGSMAASSVSYLYSVFAFSAIWFLLFGVIIGIIVIVGAFMMYSSPRQHVAWGIVVLVLSILSILSTGGLIIGLILGIIGGALGIAWKPSGVSTVPAPPIPPAITRICPQCGRVLAEDLKYCPHCGKDLA
jgi:hypothetical protein